MLSGTAHMDEDTAPVAGNRNVDDGDIEGLEVGVGSCRNALEPPADDVAGVLGRKHQQRSGLVDGRSGQRLSVLQPVDKRRNAGGVRRRTGRKANDEGANTAAGPEPAPLL